MGSPSHVDLVQLLTYYGSRPKLADPGRRAGRLRLRLVLVMPLLLARPDGSALSVITRSAKTAGGVQRTLFTRGLGPSTDDQHPDVYAAAVRAWDMGFTVLAQTRDLPAYMPVRESRM